MTRDEAISILLDHLSEGLVRTLEDAIAKEERDKCAKRASVALLGTLQTTTDRVLKAIKEEKNDPPRF